MVCLLDLGFSFGDCLHCIDSRLDLFDLGFVSHHWVVELEHEGAGHDRDGAQSHGNGREHWLKLEFVDWVEHAHGHWYQDHVVQEGE